MINEEIKRKYPDVEYVLRHTTGIDTSGLFIARTDIRGSNDLVWVGRSANYAAKLANQKYGYNSLITSDVYNMLNDQSKLGKQGKDMWTSLTWDTYNITIYGSNWYWSP